MDDNKKHELTEKLKVIECDIHDHRIDLKSIQAKLNTAYEYEDALLVRLETARKKTKELQQQFYEKSGVISQLYDKMKSIFDVFTGNFFTHI